MKSLLAGLVVGLGLLVLSGCSAGTAGVHMTSPANVSWEDVWDRAWSNPIDIKLNVFKKVTHGNCTVERVSPSFNVGLWREAEENMGDCKVSHGTP